MTLDEIATEMERWDYANYNFPKAEDLARWSTSIRSAHESQAAAVASAAHGPSLDLRDQADIKPRRAKKI